MRRFNSESRDGNHAQIVGYLRGYDIEVIETFRPLDLLIFNEDERAAWIEVKTTKRNAPIKMTQIKFMATTKMPVAFVKTEDEALEFARTLNGITEKQKKDLATFCETATRKQYHPAVIERVLSWE